VKWQLRDAAGVFIAVLPAITSTTYNAVSCTTFSSVLDPLPTSTSGKSGLTYDSAANQYHYDWKTPSQKGCYVLRIGLADGSTKVADFNLKQRRGREPCSRPLVFFPAAPGRPNAAAYMASNVSMTSIEEPPASTGQPFASPTAASRLSALMIV